MKKICFILSTVFLFSSIAAQEIFRLPPDTHSYVSSFENPNGEKGAGGKTNNTAKGNAFEPVKAGESKVLLDIKGAGTIQRIWMTISDRSPEMLRSLHLRIFWDDASQPAVDVPFGDFFCTPLGQPVAFQSAFFSNPEGRSFNCFIPMPFRKSAKVLLINDSKKDLPMLFFDIDFITVHEQPADMLYFHAYWNRKKNADLGKDFELLPRIRGKGRFLGINVGVKTDSAYTGTWYGEGEVKMFIDGDSAYPTINGTGTEDYIGTGWGEGTFAHQFEGCTVADDKKGLFEFYRFHIPDAIFFYKDFKATLQEIGGGPTELVRTLLKKGVKLKPVSVSTDTAFIRLLALHPSPQVQDQNFPNGWVNFYRVDDYSATSYFYFDKPDHDLPPLPVVAVRVE